MKIAFSTSGDNLEAPLDPRFGRARRVSDLRRGRRIPSRWSTMARTWRPRRLQGIQSAKVIARCGAKALVTGHCEPPKALRVLSAAGVGVFNCSAPTVAEALEAYRSGTLAPAESADVEGHWG